MMQPKNTRCAHCRIFTRISGLCACGFCPLCCVQHCKGASCEGENHVAQEQAPIEDQPAEEGQDEAILQFEGREAGPCEAQPVSSSVPLMNGLTGHYEQWTLEEIMANEG